jgi:uncharacterized membrane protein YfcA
MRQYFRFSYGSLKNGFLMIENFLEIDLNTVQWILACACGMMIGMAKAGLSGTGFLIVPIMAGIFGGKPSTGLVLPMLITADIFAVSYYSRHAEWKYVFKLLPWAVAGIIIGALFGNAVNDDQFKKAIGLMVIIFITLMIWQDFKKKDVTIPDFWWFSALLGLAGGFSTMVGNAAGPVMSMYLLSMRLPKNKYIGTAAWFFFIVNLIKIPLHIFYWKTIHIQSLAFDLMMIPVILMGAFLGVRIVKIIPEKGFRIFVISTTLLAAILLF